MSTLFSTLSTIDILAAFSKSLLFTLAGILPILNPLATAPLYVGFTQDLPESERAQVAKQMGKYVVLMLAGAMLVGSYVLDFFGLSLPVVRVAGGMIVASIAWRMLHTQQSSSDDNAQIAQSLAAAKTARLRAFYPMTFPLTCGPGSIAATIAVGASLHTRGNLPITFSNLLGGLSAVLLLGVLVWLTFRYASALLARLGETGQIVLMRLMAFILLCVGIQIVWEGVRVQVQVRDHQPAARAQDARRLRQGAGRVVHVVQKHVGEDIVHAGFRQGQGLGGSFQGAQAAGAGLGPERGAQLCQHGGGLVHGEDGEPGPKVIG